jgi:hypothetical protein
VHCPYLQLPLDDPIFGDSGRLPSMTARTKPAARLHRFGTRLPRLRRSSKTRETSAHRHHARDLDPGAEIRTRPSFVRYGGNEEPV